MRSVLIMKTLTLTATLLVATAPALAAVDPVRGSIYQFVQASDDYNTSDGSVTDADFYDVNWLDTPETLTISALAYAVGTATTGADAPASWVQTTANITATWDSAYQGSVDFTNMGWTTSGVTSGDAIISAVQTNPSEWAGRSWTYTFTPDTDSMFTLDYSVFAPAGNTSDFGIASFRFSCYNVDGCEGVENQTVLDVGDSGQLSFAVEAGKEARFYLDVSGYVSGGLGTRTTLTNGEFDWRITPVPEPQSWAMLLAGVGVLSLRVAARRRRAI